MEPLTPEPVMQAPSTYYEIGIAILIGTGILALVLLSSGLVAHPTPPVTTAEIPVPDAFTQVPVEAEAAVVYDLATGNTLYAKNADAQLPLASLTKLLSVYAALAQLPPTTPITISATAARLEPPRAFNQGQVLTLGDLSRLTLTASLNDGAAAISEAVAARENSSQPEILARAASALNLSQTYAVNGNGLDVNETLSGGYGSARDLAHLAGALVELAPSIAAATTQSFAQAVSRGGTHFSVKNTDPMVGNIPHLLLSKTGYTDLAGGNLALVFDVGIQHPIAIVVLGSSVQGRFADGTTLIAATLAHFAGVTSL